MKSWKFFGKIPYKDIILLASIPLILTIIFLLPSSIKDTLILHYYSPTILGFYFTHFVHETMPHFLGNLFLYLVLMALIYLFAVVSKNKKEFYWVFFIFVILLPLVLSSISLSLVRAFHVDIQRGLGFSGIDSAFLGVVPFFIFSSIKKKLWPDVEIADGLLAVLFFTFVVEMVTYGVTRSYGIILLIVVSCLFFFYLWKLIKSMKIHGVESLRKMFHDKPKRYTFLLISLTFLLYASALPSL